MRFETDSAPWEMPGLDALEARALGRGPDRVHRAHRRAEAFGAAVVALLLLTLIPAQSGAVPAEADSGAVAVAAATAPATAATAPTAPATPATTPAAPATAAPSSEPVATLPAVVDVEAVTEIAAATQPPTPQPTATPARGDGNPQPALVAGPSAAATPAPQPSGLRQTYRKDLYDAASIRYQDPDMTACTAASTEVMLNLISRRGTHDGGFVWTPTTSYDTQESVLTWERAHHTLDAGAPGSDPHGWRNALNYYGWSQYTSPAVRHYDDIAYASFDDAVRAAVVALARENQPVGLLGWAGGHAQIMTGYEVYGLDPATSSDFAVQAVYITDVLASNHLLDVRITYSALQSGPTVYRFRAYEWKDSAADDPYTPGTVASWREWYGKWVIVAPVSPQSAVPAVSH
jgi:hypothetical protein